MSGLDLSIRYTDSFIDHVQACCSVVIYLRHIVTPCEIWYSHGGQSQHCGLLHDHLWYIPHLPLPTCLHFGLFVLVFLMLYSFSFCTHLSSSYSFSVCPRRICLTKQPSSYWLSGLPTVHLYHFTPLGFFFYPEDGEHSSVRNVNHEYQTSHPRRP
jgi:hypothetical protein